MLGALVCRAEREDYDDEGYGNQGGNGNQPDSDGYSGYNNDDGYATNNPNYNQNIDSESSNNNPNNVYSSQGGNDADGDYEGDDGSSAAASSLEPTIVRIKRSTQPAESLEAPDQAVEAASEPKLRVKRHGKYYIGPVYTYVKTDKHANFKWGVSDRKFLKLSN